MSNHVSSLVYKRVIGSSIRKAVLAYMADKASDDGSGVWASKATIAAELECSPTSVKKCIREFCEEGLCAEVGKRKFSNGFTYVYDLHLDAIEALPTISSNKGVISDGVTGRPRHQATPTGSLGDPQGGHQATPNHPKTQENPNVSAEPPHTEDELDNLFEDFWNAHPRRVRRDETKTAFLQAVADGVDPQAIINGARRYANEQHGNAKQFLCMSINWIEQKRWEDQPEHGEVDRDKLRETLTDSILSHVPAVREAGKRSWQKYFPGESFPEKPQDGEAA